MLTVRTLAAAEGVSVATVACRQEPPRGTPEEARDHALVFVRRGWFSRTVEGAHAVVDPTLAYSLAPGDEQRYDHPHGQADDCTYLVLAPAVVADLTGGGRRLPPGPFPTSPALHLAQRRLLTLAREGDRDALGEHGLSIAAAVVSGAGQGPPVLPRGVAARRRHRALVLAARAALAGEPNLSLTDLARSLACSPHHLSRVFRAGTGMTVSRYRMRLRARAALERIADGERDLAGLAAELGLADQSHLNRILRTEAARTPTELRRLMTSANPPARGR